MHPWGPPFDLPWDSPPPPVESSGFFTRVAWSELRCSNQNGRRIVVVSSRLLTEDVSFLDLKIVHVPSKESYFLWISKNYVHQQVWKNNVNLACVFTSTAFGGRHLTCGSSSVPFNGRLYFFTNYSSWKLRYQRRLLLMFMVFICNLILSLFFLNDLVLNFIFVWGGVVYFDVKNKFIRKADTFKSTNKFKHFCRECKLFAYSDLTDIKYITLV